MSGKRSKLDQAILEHFEATEPENRVARYREKLEQLPEVSKLPPERLKYFVEHVAHSLDLAERRIKAGADYNEIHILLEEARHGLLNAVHEPFVKIGAKHSKRQSERGKAGAAARWANREEIAEIIKRLALKRDWMGDYLHADELWPEFQGDLDAAGLKSKMTFKTFKNRLAQVRN